jgi:hypothetical protein
LNDFRVGRQSVKETAMNPNALANLASPDIQSLTYTAASELNSLRSRNGAGSPASSEFSSFAEVLSALQQLQHYDPAQYAQVTKKIAYDLGSASRIAREEGNDVQALRLSTLSDDFNHAAINDQLPTVADLAEAVSGHHRHHQYHDYSCGGSLSNVSSGRSKDFTTSTNSMKWAGSTISTGWAAISAAAASVSQLLTASVAKAAWANSLKPMKIVANTLRQQWLNFEGLIPGRAHREE